MQLRPYISRFFRYFDLFSITQFLRYKQQEDFKTASGGTVSLLIVGIFLALFFNTALQTINKSIINWSSSSTFINQPPPTTLVFSNSSFMFTVGVIGLDLNDPNFRYFDVKMLACHNTFVGSVVEQIEIPLVQCTKQHFGINPQLSDSYDKISAAQWLCPPLNYSFQIYGKFISKDMKYIQISINKCNNSLNPSRPCVPQSTIDSMILNYGPFSTIFFYMNPMINPGKADYLSHYMQSSNFLTFTKDLGGYGFGYVQDYMIETDQSLLPFASNTIERGVTIPDFFQTVPYQVTYPKYASFNLIKSSLQTVYNRSFNKIDQFFSYVGGLVGTILGMMLFMGNFTSMAFELDLWQKLFKYSQNEEADFKKFNLLHYLAYGVYEIGRYFNCCQSWTQMKKKQHCVSEVQKQLDISLILRRLNFLQKAISDVLGPEQFQITHLQKKQILAEVKARRRLYSKKKKHKQQSQIIFKDQQQQSSSEEGSQKQDEPTVKETAKRDNSQNQHFQQLKRSNKDEFCIANEDEASQSSINKQKNLNKQQLSQGAFKNNSKNKVHSLFQLSNISYKSLHVKPIGHEPSLVQFYQKQNNKEIINEGFSFEKLDDQLA